jgi:SAM-dependent methyltransferase
MIPDSDYAYLRRHRAIWAGKPVLRRIYGEQYYARLLSACAPGSKNLEIGSGPGFIADFAPNVIRTDILPSPWIHCAVDAHQLPFDDGTFDNVLGLDVLHHFNKPTRVLGEVSRVLRSGGRFILVEPWITPFSRLVYTYLHQEECDLTARPWLEEDDQFQGDKKAFDGNAAIPYLFIKFGGDTLQHTLPDLKLLKVERFSLFTYLLSFGFKPSNFLPNALYKPAYALESATHPLWERLAALRALIVWEKTT